MLHACRSGHNLTLPRQAFEIPPALQPLLSQLTPERRRELRANPRNLSAEALTESIVGLEIVDVDNTIAPPRTRPPGLLRVAELNAQRGAHWCE